MSAVDVETSRTRLLSASAIYRFPEPSRATATGSFISAEPAAPPSPENPGVPAATPAMS